jgi:hypothetical protein
MKSPTGLPRLYAIFKAQPPKVAMCALDSLTLAFDKTLFLSRMFLTPSAPSPNISQDAADYAVVHLFRGFAPHGDGAKISINMLTMK